MMLIAAPSPPGQPHHVRRRRRIAERLELDAHLAALGDELHDVVVGGLRDGRGDAADRRLELADLDLDLRRVGHGLATAASTGGGAGSETGTLSAT